MRDKTIALLWIATLIAILEAMAMMCGHDGYAFLSVIGTLSGLFGYYLGIKKNEL